MLPSRPQTFGLESCRDLLEKLKWEIEGLETHDNSDVKGLTFRAWNACVTAWHLTDWVWNEMTTTQRATLMTSSGSPIKTPAEFQTQVRNECRAMHAFRQIATASKHWKTEKHPDPAVAAEVSLVSSTGIILGESRLDYPDWALRIELDGGSENLIDLLNQALSYWTQFIFNQGISA